MADVSKTYPEQQLPPPQYQQQWQQQQQQQQPWGMQQQQQPQVIYTNGTPVTIIQTTTMMPMYKLGRYGPHFHFAKARCCGGLLVALGIVSWTAATCAWLWMAGNSWLFTGYWCGSVMVVAGIIASHAARMRTDCMIVTNLITAILSICFATTQFGISLNGLLYNVYWCYMCEPAYDYIYGYNYDAAVASNSVLLAMGAAAWFPSFALLGISCKAICCHKEVKPDTTQTTTGFVVQTSGGVQVQQMQQPI